MKRILILFAHPALRRSRVNKIMVSDLGSLGGVTVRDLYELYPDLDIDIDAEQAALVEHDVIVFQHPFYWYSTPAILKEWQDLVLEHGWAYGREGTALSGKLFFSAVTTGGPRETYRKNGYNRFTISQFLAPVEQTARLCNMTYLPPFVVHGTHGIDPDAVATHHAHYLETLRAVGDDTLDIERTRKLEYLNDALSVGAGSHP